VQNQAPCYGRCFGDSGGPSFEAWTLALPNDSRSAYSNMNDTIFIENIIIENIHSCVLVRVLDSYTRVHFGSCIAQVLEKLAKELMMRLDYNGHFSAEAV